MTTKVAQLPNGLKYLIQNRFLNFGGPHDVSKKNLHNLNLDGADQIRRAKEMTPRDAFDFLRHGGHLHQQTIELAVDKLNKEQVMMLLAGKPPHDISIPLQVRMQKLERNEGV